MKIKTDILNGDCAEVLKTLKDNSIDLIMTSPPYAMQRKQTYGGIETDKYVDWFLPISKELYRVLNDNGSFVLNIKEHTENNQRVTYVLELILALKKQGWKWIDEFVWHKPNPFPRCVRYRLKDGWERCLHFAKTNNYQFYPNNVKVKSIRYANGERRKITKKDLIPRKNKTGSGFAMKNANGYNLEYIHASNVITIPSGCDTSVTHSATFPKDLPKFFIKLLTKQYDTVLEPFSGSGTTLIVANSLFRNSIGIEINNEYVNEIKKKIQNETYILDL